MRLHTAFVLGDAFVDTYLQILIIRRQSRWLAILIFLIVLFIYDFVVILVELESPIDGA